MLTPEDFSALWITAKLAFVVTLILLSVGFPLAYWLSRSRSMLVAPVNALISLPLILPPTVLGFYVLLVLGPKGPLGEFTQWLGLGLLPFTFWGLVIGSCVYSLPFVVQPLQASMSSLGERPLEVAATLGASPVNRFFTVSTPLAVPGIVTAAVLGFAHTVGEFGVVLMIGGNIPDETRVVSVQIYDYVEVLDYERAHILSALMVGFSFCMLLALYASGRTRPVRFWR